MTDGNVTLTSCDVPVAVAATFVKVEEPPSRDTRIWKLRGYSPVLVPASSVILLMLLSPSMSIWKYWPLAWFAPELHFVVAFPSIAFEMFVPVGLAVSDQPDVESAVVLTLISATDHGTVAVPVSEILM
ncbi:MAG TPA: hypothetical protein VHJ20_24780 [Polyangia bacterium]|nr:hypothetical protein [Polyangia bacterium]